MKHRILSLVLSLTALTSLATLTSCSEEAVERAPREGDMKIVTTIFPQYDFVREIAGDAVELTMLLSPGAESHSYEPTPQDIITIQECDLFIYVGGDTDIWVTDIIDDMGKAAPDTLCLIDLVDTVTEEIVEGMEHNHDHDHSHWYDFLIFWDHDHDHDHDHDDVVDEHVWTSPENAMELVSAITDVLVAEDPDNATMYQENCKNYLAELERLHFAYQEVLDNATRTVILFGDRYPFRYFSDAYGLEYYAAFTGCSTESDASAATVAFLVDKVRELDLPVVFTIEMSTGRIADTICEETGATRMTLYSCHNITADMVSDGVSYLDMMWWNVDTLRVALS